MRYLIIIIAAVILGILAFIYFRRSEHVLNVSAKFMVLSESIFYIYGEYLESQRDVMEKKVERVPVTIIAEHALYQYDPDNEDDNYAQFLLFFSILNDHYDEIKKNEFFLRSDDFEKIEETKKHIDEICHHIEYQMWLSGYKVERVYL